MTAALQTSSLSDKPARVAPAAQQPVHKAAEIRDMGKAFQQALRDSQSQRGKADPNAAPAPATEPAPQKTAMPVKAPVRTKTAPEEQAQQPDRMPMSPNLPIAPAIKPQASPVEEKRDAQSPIVAAPPPPLPAAPATTPTPPGAPVSQAEFAALFAQLDRGTAASARSDVTLSGDQWLARQVQVDQAANGLVLTVDLKQQGSTGETLADLRRRLKAKHIEARVQPHDDLGLPPRTDGV